MNNSRQSAGMNVAVFASHLLCVNDALQLQHSTDICGLLVFSMHFWPCSCHSCGRVVVLFIFCELVNKCKLIASLQSYLKVIDDINRW